MDFEEEVINASHKAPVVVDFWAPWCGPCQVIGPALEALEKEQSSWNLVKVNVDEHPTISQQFGIRGIPDVRLFSKGVEVNRFTGALPKHEMEKWLRENIPDERLHSLELLVAQSTEEKGHKQLRAFVEGNSDFKPGFVALARLILWENPDEMQTLLASVTPADKEHAIAQALREMAALLTYQNDDDLPVASKLTAAREAFRSSDMQLGIELLIQAVTINKNFAEELPRRASIAFFQIMGSDHPLTKNYRRKFDMALY